jgi:hypothetical protein
MLHNRLVHNDTGGDIDAITKHVPQREWRPWLVCQLWQAAGFSSLGDPHGHCVIQEQRNFLDQLDVLGIELFKTWQEDIQIQITLVIKPYGLVTPEKMSSRLECLELILARVLPKVWMIPTAIRLSLLPKVVNALFHFQRSRDQQSIALLDFPIRVICTLLMKDYYFIHNGGTEISHFIRKVFVHQLVVSLDARKHLLK